MIELQIPNALGPGKIFHVNETSSTMADAAKLADDGCEHGTVVCAAHQRSGRGRVFSRRWEDLPGENLMLTFVLRPEALVFTDVIPLRCGVALSLWLESLGVTGVTIKWPNDVLVDGKKISGILCESFPRYVLCGIGVNVRQKTFPPYPTPAVSFIQLGLSGEPLSFLSGLLPFLAAALEMEEVLDSLNVRLYGKGAQACFQYGPVESHESVEGEIIKVDSSGQLLLKTVDGVKAFGAGEISTDKH